MKLVIVESPFAGHAPRWTRWIPLLGKLIGWIIASLRRWRNVRYARAALRDCLIRGEYPLASHLLYTQPGVLRDYIPEERALGIEAGLAWGKLAAETVVYCDLGESRGMQLGVHRASLEGRKVSFRTIPAWSEYP